MVFCVALLAFLSIGAGIFISYPTDYVKVAVSQMAGIVK